MKELNKNTKVQLENFAEERNRRVSSLYNNISERLSKNYSVEEVAAYYELPLIFVLNLKYEIDKEK
jgi:DNA-directed RNA polymerase specialized sigma subunit